MSWFSEGYEAVDQRAKELDEQQNQNFIPNFILKEDDFAKILFLTNAPLNFYEHYVKSLNRYFTCSQNNCALCDAGNKPSYRGAYLILDTRYEEWEKDGQKKTQQNTVKVMKQGIKAMKVIKKHEERRGLLKHGWEVERTGSGTDTTYTFLPMDINELTDGIKVPTPEEIEAAKQTMMEAIKPKSREDILDILAGRTPQSNRGQQNQQQNQQQNNNNNGGFSTNIDDDEGRVLSFM